ncbi:MAG: hypothetical protein HC841_00820 [Verrucomicrobiae bacterium]|nr:hypothetical protein [Verrucomicrobiae bacterium]
MNALLKKELRLLLPASLLALPLALLTPWILLAAQFLRADFIGAAFTTFAVCILLMMLLASAAFGLEFSHGTFDAFLAQPVPRRRLFVTKCAALGIALAGLWTAAWASVFATLIASKGAELFSDIPELAREIGPSLALSVAIVFAVFSIGLWSALLLRQMILSFWAALTAHAAVLAALTWVETLFKDALTIPAYVCVIALYGIAGLVAAWRLFKRVECVPPHWVNLEMPSFGSAGNAESPSRIVSTRRPLVTLVRLELSLQFATFIGAGILLLFTIGCFTAGGAGWIRKGSMLDVVPVLLEMFWFLIPLVAGACAVAEERRMGTWVLRLCLPVARWKQFAIKFVVAVGVGLLLGIGGLVVCEVLGRVSEMSTLLGDLKIEPLLAALARGHGSWDKATRLDVIIVLRELFGGVAIFLSLTLSLGLGAFYASTLSRNTLQAIGLGLVVVAAGLLLLLSGPLLASGYYGDWHYPHFAMQFGGAFVWISWVLFATLSVTLVVLSARNCFNTQAGPGLLLRNLRTISGVVVVTLMVCGAVYLRAWELVMTEAPHGPAQITSEGIPKLAFGWPLNRMFVLLPDGRLWISDKRDDRSPSKPPYYFSEKGRFLPSSTWTGLAVNSQHALAIRSDGTLWSLMRMAPAPVPPESGSRHIRYVAEDTPQQLDSETNWVAIASSDHRVMALKRDGSLWGWHSERHGEAPAMPTLRRIGEDSNWASLHGSKQLIIGVTRDGRAAQWMDDFYRRSYSLDTPVVFPLPNDSNNPDHLRRVSTVNWSGVLLTSEGTLHQFTRVFERSEIRYPNRDGILPAPTSHAWRDACMLVDLYWRDHPIAGITSDGRLWWNVGRKSDRFARLGNHSDWIAVERFDLDQSSFMALARDGTLSFWFPYEHWSLLAPSRLPSVSINIFDAPE